MLDGFFMEIGLTFNKMSCPSLASCSSAYVHTCRVQLYIKYSMQKIYLKKFNDNDDSKPLLTTNIISPELNINLRSEVNIRTNTSNKRIKIRIVIIKWRIIAYAK